MAIAERAIETVGSPFRLRGRSVEAGLDCVGVVAHALEYSGCQFDVPHDYALRGEYLARIFAFFDADCFRQIDTEPALPGDISLGQPAARQLHFAVHTMQGLVHAHAGLRSVVITPPPLPWPAIAHWRFIGD